ncbi:MAG: RnfABCDGE type electron transport complex subunit D, partial [Oscillospiraceae bacterium]|nr:RnfABCDGE type electron transport complex subunit D [Oscillospiraceae bacterium]
MHKLHIESAPHTHGNASASSMMLLVIIALLPAAITGIFNYGTQAAMLLFVSIGSAFVTEALMTLIFRHRMTVRDLSAVVTGLILGMLLPPDLEPWKAALGSVLAIAIKQFFGGIGKN